MPSSVGWGTEYHPHIAFDPNLTSSSSQIEGKSGEERSILMVTWSISFSSTRQIIRVREEESLFCSMVLNSSE